MFIRKRRSSKHASHQIIQTYRKGGKVKQRVIYNLGRHATIEDALKAKHRQIKSLQEICTVNFRGVPVTLSGAATHIAELRADIAKLEALARSVKGGGFAAPSDAKVSTLTLRPEAPR